MRTLAVLAVALRKGFLRRHLAQTSVDDGGVNELPGQPAVVSSHRPRRLTHIDRNHTRFGLDPEIGLGVSTPGEFTYRVRHADHALCLP